MSHDHTEPCPLCVADGQDAAGNNLAVYEDGGKYCHARHGVVVRSDGGVPDTPPKDSEFKHGEYRDLVARGIPRDICQKYKYQVTDAGTEISNYYKSGKLLAQQWRNSSKQFCAVGPTASGEFFGQNTCRGRGGKWIVVTEGQYDAMTIAKVSTHFDAVSLTNGAKSVEKNFQNNMEFLNQYENVIIAFDQDEDGLQATEAVIKGGYIRPGKLKIATLRYKDANEYIQNRRGKSKQLMEDLWGASAYCPPGIISASEVDSKRDSKEVLSYFDPNLTRFMLGREIHTATVWLSGTGSGKTTKLKQDINHDLEQGITVGAILLEESPWDTMMDLASIRMGKAVRKILRQRKALALDSRITDPMFEDDLDDDEIEKQFGWVKTRPLHLWNPDEPPNYEAILSRMEHMSIGLGCKTIYLDHMSLMQFGSKGEMDGLDDFAVKLKSLVLRCPSHFSLVSQLSQGDGKKSHEEGGRIKVKHMRGRQIVPSVFNEIMSLQRDQQAETEEERNRTHVTCLKSRLGGETGYVTSYQYDKQSGRLNSTSLKQDPMQHLTTPQADFRIEDLA